MKFFKKKEINKDISVSLDIICHQYETIITTQADILEKLDVILGNKAIHKETGAKNADNNRLVHK